tara:strand:+ start:1111 stop:2106 length:996 start_codon:yes stop_codon:yes gene_type:complete
MALPRQVQAQLAEVEELEKTLNAQTEAPKKKKAKEPKVSEVTPEDTEAEVPVEAEAAVEPEEAKPADTSPTDVADEFEQKYKTLRGKYDAEVPRLHSQVKDLTAKLNNLSESLTAKPKEPTKPKEKVSYVTDEDRAEFGEELIGVQRRVAQEVSQEYEGRFEQQSAVIEQLQKQLKVTGNQVGEMSFSQKLSQIVPDFASIDNDERWVEWLNEYDPMLRGPRRDQAAQAFNTGDAEAVAHYVKLWRESLGPDVPQERQNRQAELEKQVAPNRSANSATTKSVGKDAKFYSEREISAAWNKIRTLNTRHKYDEATKLEADITTAYLEGRVRA